MADNKQLPPTGTGTADIVVATDEIAGVDYQRIKLVDGTDGATTGAKVSSEGNLQTITPNRTASGTLDADEEALEIDCEGAATVSFQVTASNLSGVLTFDGSVDGTNWAPNIIVGYYGGVGAQYEATNPSAGEQYALAAAPWKKVRVRISTYTSGSVAIVALASSGSTEWTPSTAQIIDSSGQPVSIGNGVAGNALRVTVADDSTGVLSVDDNGGTLTVDGTVTANLAAGTNNIGDVDVLSIASGDNNIGNVDVVTLPALVAGSANIGDVDVLTVPAPLSTTGGGTEATALRVTVANNSTGVVAVTQSGTWDEVGINDSGNSITVDQATGTNLHTVVDSGTVTAVTSITNPVTVAGGAAHASPVSGNPNLVAGRASTAVPTDVGADGDAASLWTQRNGALVGTMAPHVGLVGSPWTLASKTAQYTGTQTSAVLLAGGASDRIVVTKVQIQVGGTTAGTLQLYFGTGAYSRGTSFAIFDGEFAPSATLKPGVVMDGPFIAGTVGDDVLVTDSAAINPLTITIWYYLVT